MCLSITCATQSPLFTQPIACAFVYPMWGDMPRHGIVLKVVMVVQMGIMHLVVLFVPLFLAPDLQFTVGYDDLCSLFFWFRTANTNIKLMQSTHKLSLSKPVSSSAVMSVLSNFQSPRVNQRCLLCSLLISISLFASTTTTIQSSRISNYNAQNSQ